MNTWSYGKSCDDLPVKPVVQGRPGTCKDLLSCKSSNFVCQGKLCRTSQSAGRSCCALKARAELTGGKQVSFIDYGLTSANKHKIREKFLDWMEVVVTWQAIADMVETHYTKASKIGVMPPYLLTTTLRLWKRLWLGCPSYGISLASI
jgi:hypothetical protein